MKTFGKILLYLLIISVGLSVVAMIVNPNTNTVARYGNPFRWEQEQRDHWKAGLNSAILIYQEEYNATKSQYDVLPYGILSSSLKNILITNLSDMADCILMASHQIMTEPLAEEETIYEVLKYRLLVKSDYIPGGIDYSDGFVKESHKKENTDALYDDWLYSLSCLALSEESVKEIIEEASYEGKINHNYYHDNEVRDRRVAELRQILRQYYDSVEAPSITYDEFEVWACCFILYNKDFDFNTTKKIIADKTIKGNIALKPNTGSPIIL